MRHKKLASLVAIVILGIAAPFVSIPRVQAFHSDVTATLTGVQRYSDPVLGTVDAAKEGSMVTFDVKIVADSTVGAATGQRNITVGAKFDWMPNYVNASNANPTSTLSLMPKQYVTVTVSITLPTISGQYTGYNLYTHTWDVKVWSGAANSAVGPSIDCTHTGGSIAGCVQRTQPVNFAIYSAAQADGMAARNEASLKAGSLSSVLNGLTELPAGASKAVADVSAATAEISLGDQSYRGGDLNAAKTHYTNALNSANSAMSALNGGDAAGYTNVLLSGIGWLLAGVGVFIAGFGAFWHLRKKPKA